MVPIPNDNCDGFCFVGVCYNSIVEDGFWCNTTCNCSYEKECTNWQLVAIDRVL